MIDIGNLRVENNGEWTRLVADISADFERSDHEDSMWIAVRNENADMLTADVYDAFLLLPLYMAMYHKSDLHLHGNVSKTLYKNVTMYLEKIMCSFSDDLAPVQVIVDGFAEAENTHRIIGTGLSGGVDCLSTIYSHYRMEQDEDERINGLFMLNVGWHGDYYRPQTRQLFFDRCKAMKKLADALGLAFYEVDSNLHAFLPGLGDRCSYFGIYTAIFALEKAIGRYYMASSLSYREILQWSQKSHDNDWSEYADPYALPLIKSKALEFVSDGCQYTRSQKTELIADWEIAQNYLEVCMSKEAVGNCSACPKCVRTLLPLEAMGKLEAFSKVFDIEAYRKQAFWHKCRLAIANGRAVFPTDNYQYCTAHGMQIPSKVVARIYTFPRAFPGYIRKLFQLIASKVASSPR